MRNIKFKNDKTIVMEKSEHHKKLKNKVPKNIKYKTGVVENKHISTPHPIQESLIKNGSEI